LSIFGPEDTVHMGSMTEARQKPRLKNVENGSSANKVTVEEEEDDDDDMYA
jgi:uncharacterized UBP type Zn finger protein